MQFSIDTFFNVSVLLAIAGIASGLFGWLLIIVANAGTKGQFSLRKEGLLTKIALINILFCAFSIGISLLGFIIAGIWWASTKFLSQTTLIELALFFFILGITPLFISLFAIVLTKVIGGTVNASKAQNCYLFGIDISGVVHTLFMSYLFTYITGGLAVLGLIVSGVWALFR